MCIHEVFEGQGKLFYCFQGAWYITNSEGNSLWARILPLFLVGSPKIERRVYSQILNSILSV